MSEKKFLIVVDMQNDFIDGSLGTAEAVQIVPAVAERIRAARAAGAGRAVRRRNDAPADIRSAVGERASAAGR